MPLELPATYADIYLDANKQYPQAQTAIALRTGAVALQQLSHGQVSREQLHAYTPTPDQIAAAAATMIELHGAFGVPCHYTETPDSQDPYAVTPQRLSDLMTGWLGVMEATGAALTQSIHGEARIPLPDRVMLARGIRTSRYDAAEHAVSKWLFARDEQGRVCPELTALSGLYACAAEVLHGRPALAIASDYRHIIAEMFRPGTTDQQWIEALRHLDGVRPALSGLVLDSLAAARPVIEARTGLRLSDRALSTFTHNTVSDVAVRRRRPVRAG
jgi:hypothetical protein